MTDASRNLWVGLFIVVAVGALSILMVWFGEAPSWMGGSEWTLRITGVHNLRGIGQGSQVSLNGVEIGRVDRVDFITADRPGRGVVIFALIKDRYTVPHGARAMVYGATLGFGTGHVAIVIEPSVEPVPIPKEDASIPGEMKSIFGEVVNKDMLGSVERAISHIGDLTREWTPVGTNLAQMLERRSADQVGQTGASGKKITPNISTKVERIDQLA